LTGVRNLRRRPWCAASLSAALLLLACGRTGDGTGDANGDSAVTGAAVSATSWCARIPRPENTRFRRVDVPGGWHEVYSVEPGVFAITEPRQFQEAISYLIVGDSGAVLFDSGIGLVPLAPVVQALTSKPVRVLNSHSHFDHVGANHEFEQVLALDLPFTRDNEGGTPHHDVADEVMPDAFCGTSPANADTATFRSRPWRVARRVAIGDTLSLGDRVLEILAAPGHTPDAIVLHDRTNGLLFTGDTFYESQLWFFAKETDIDAYERTMHRLSALAPSLRRVLPAHNTVSASPSRLTDVARAVRVLREGGGVRVPQGEGDREAVTVGDVRFLVRRASPAATERPRPQ
jgi:glyoxylase-like metal-dependent hydrolase (beta-lactamase superfamily II)